MSYVQTPAERAEAFVPLVDAILYLQERAQRDDPELGHLLGPGTEAFRLLCLAEAAATRRPVADVERDRRRDLVPAHRVRPLRHERDEAHIDLLRDYLSGPALAEVDAELEGWSDRYVSRRLARRNHRRDRPR